MSSSPERKAEDTLISIPIFGINILASYPKVSELSPSDRKRFNEMFDYFVSVSGEVPVVIHGGEGEPYCLLLFREVGERVLRVLRDAEEYPNPIPWSVILDRMEAVLKVKEK